MLYDHYDLRQFRLIYIQSVEISILVQTRLVKAATRRFWWESRLIKQTSQLIK